MTAGASLRVTPDSHLQVTVRRLGPAPLIEDNSARSKASTIVNLGYAYDLGPVTLSLDLLNLLGSRDNDITYFHASRLLGEPAQGIEDIHFHPVEPRQVRAGLRYTF